MQFWDKFEALINDCESPYPDVGFLAAAGSEHDLIKVSQAAYALKPEPPKGVKLRNLNALEIQSIYAQSRLLRMSCLHIAHVAAALSRAKKGGWACCRHIEFQIADAGDIRVSVLSRHEIHGTLADVPKMLFDATAQPELLAGIFPNLRQVCDLKACDGHGVRRYQLRDSAVSMTALQENPTWPARVLLLASILDRSCGRTGVISTKSLMAKIVEFCGPDNRFEIGHFGAVKGVNRFEDCAALILCGRLAVTPSVAERIASVLLERDVTSLGDTRFPKAKQFLAGRQTKTGWEVQVATHLDPAVNAARASITEDQLEQARGRGRNTRRDASKPLTEFVLTNVPSEYPVDGTFTLREFYAATTWPTLLLNAGVWLAEGKGSSIVTLLVQAAMANSQKGESLYISLIGNPAFESPQRAAEWRTDQLADNPELAAFVAMADKQFEVSADTLSILFVPFPIADFQPVRAKVRGARYYAQLYVRTRSGQAPQDALRELLGPLADEVEIEGG